MPIPQESVFSERLNAKERVLQTLSDWIVNGTLEPGERIYDEELSKYFHVSRTPVREALQALCEKRLVEILPSRGTRVAPVDLEEMRQVYPLLAELHSFAVRLAFDKITPDVLVQLAQVNESLRQSVLGGDQLGFQKKDRQFHQILVALSGNNYLANYLNDLQLHADRVEFQYFRNADYRTQSVNGHSRIISALQEGNCLAAIEAMEENWMITFRYLEETILQ